MSDRQSTGSFGTTWWGRRWRRVLESLGATYPNPRLPQGRSLARKGAVQDLVVEPGTVRAQVRARNQVHDVVLTLPVFTDTDWETAVAVLAGQLRHAAALLGGELPEDVDDTLRGVDLSLFPRHGELGSTCTCTSRIEPCAHAAAVHYVLAPLLDADPFLLTRLRGRERDPLLAELRAARSGGAVESEPPRPTLDQLDPETLFTARGDLAAIAVHPHQPDDRMPEALRLLGEIHGLDRGTWQQLVLAGQRARTRAWALMSAATG
ncbi:SWIM zinc finger family protein [Saccharopolyspora sp. 5N708]|uniref:SWIM zinc finger family protein n=1 Tax=Saccharopolyspora sp. 5N708 TaxID=3457424 RepID=UPI003FCEE9EA